MASPEAETHHGSPWPIVVSAGVGIAFLGLGFLDVVWILAGALIFVAAVAGWVWDDTRSRAPHVPGARTAEEGHLQALSPRKFGMWLFLASEIMFFSAIIGGSFALRQANAAAWPAPGEVLDVPITAINTFILISSSLTMAEALHAIQKGDSRQLALRLLLTLLLGLTFISIQAFEYLELIAKEGLLPFAAPHGVPTAYGATFYLQTGFHGAHVSGGLLALAYVTYRAFKGAFTKENHRTVEIMGLYWHFVDVVWIFLFPIVYLI